LTDRSAYFRRQAELCLRIAAASSGAQMVKDMLALAERHLVRAAAIERDSDQLPEQTAGGRDSSFDEIAPT
jgi:hypothetical protein